MRRLPEDAFDYEAMARFARIIYNHLERHDKFITDALPDYVQDMIHRTKHKMFPLTVELEQIISSVLRPGMSQKEIVSACRQLVPELSDELLAAFQSVEIAEFHAEQIRSEQEIQTEGKA